MHFTFIYILLYYVVSVKHYSSDVWVGTIFCFLMLTKAAFN